MRREAVVAEAALRVNFGLWWTLRAGEPRTFVSALDVLPQVGGRLEHLGALRAAVRSGCAMPVPHVLGQLGPRAILLVTEVAEIVVCCGC
jgi:hypothetical protein